MTIISKELFDLIKTAFGHSDFCKLNRIYLSLGCREDGLFDVEVNVLTGCPGDSSVESMAAHAKDLAETVEAAKSIEAMNLKVSSDMSLHCDEETYRVAESSLDKYAKENTLDATAIEIVSSYLKDY